MELFDSHAHYNDKKFEDDINNVLKQVYESGITKIVCAGYDILSSEKATKIAEKYKFVYSTVGISPNDIPFLEEQVDINTFEIQFDKQLQIIKQLANLKKVVAIGEIGLDYYWNKNNKENQKKAFLKQIELANELELPIVIHTREAVNDTIDILKNKMTVNKKGIFHCCPLNTELIKQGVKLGFYISFAGPITFKNSKNVTQAIQLVPLDKILIETDSPYLAPEPKRGTRNNSENIKYIAEKIAQIKKISIEQVSKITYENAIKVFEI